MELLLFPETSEITMESSISKIPVKLVRFIKRLEITEPGYFSFVPGSFYIHLNEELLLQAIKFEEKNKEFHLTGYNFCGPGTKVVTRLLRGDKPINHLDYLCMIHDIDYMIAAGDANMIRAADTKLLDSIFEHGWEKIKNLLSGSIKTLVSIGRSVIASVGGASIKTILDESVNINDGITKAVASVINTETEEALLVALIFIAKKQIEGYGDSAGINFSSVFSDLVSDNSLGQEKTREVGFILKERFLDKSANGIQLLVPCKFLENCTCIGGSFKVESSKDIFIKKGGNDSIVELFKEKMETIIVDNSSILFKSEPPYNVTVCMLLELMGSDNILKREEGLAKQALKIPKHLQYSSKEEKLIFLEQWTKTNG